MNNQFLFFIHPRTRVEFKDDVVRTLGRKWGKRLGWLARLLPTAWWLQLLHAMVLKESRPCTWQGEAIGSIGVVGAIADELIPPQDHPDRLEAVAWAESVVLAAVVKASDAYSHIGLGALTAPATRGGSSLVDGLAEKNMTRPYITNGNTLTAYLTHLSVQQQIKTVQSLVPDWQPRIAVLGANGSVGRLVSLLLLQAGAIDPILICSNPVKANILQKEVTRKGYVATTNADMETLIRADLIVVTTSGVKALLSADMLTPGTLVYDDTQPRNCRPAHFPPVSESGILVIDGAIMEVDGLRVGMDIDLPKPNQVYACLAETMLMAEFDITEHFSIGRDLSLAKVQSVADLYQRSRYQFHPSAVMSFRKVVEQTDWQFLADAIKQRRH
ncbi:MAG: hypothetical protein ACKKL5_02705 [Candidatus Komeilibacteria bacterium]